MYKIQRIKKLLILFLGLLSFQISFSQENYISGYIVNQTGEKLHGFIDYRNWDLNPYRISFKSNLEASPIYYTPADIAEFGVRDEIYVSGMVEAEISPIKTENLGYEAEFITEVQSVFLQALYMGEKSLFYYKDSDGKDHFYVATEKGIDLLLYKRYYRQLNPELVITENKRFIGQLTVYLIDCETLDSKMQNTRYTKRSLMKLFDHYYGCSSHTFSFQKKVEGINSEWGVVAGASMTSLHFEGREAPYLNNADFSVSSSVAFGGHLDLVLPRGQRKWSIYNELLVTSYKIQGQSEEYKSADVYSLSSMDFQYSYVKLNTLLRYTYPIRKWGLILNGGFSNGVAFTASNVRKKESQFYSTQRIEFIDAIQKTRNYEQGILLGTGVSYANFSLEARCELGNGMSDSMTVKSTTRRLYFLLGYRF